MLRITLIAIGTVCLSLILDGMLIHQRRPKTGFVVGLAPILTHMLIYIIPGLMCESDNPVGCEWAGIGSVILTGITLEMLIGYILLHLGLARTHRSHSRSDSNGVSSRKFFLISFRTIVTLLALGTIGGFFGNLILILVGTGIFIPWQDLGTPPDLYHSPVERAVRIQSYNIWGVQIETNKGGLFQTEVGYCVSPQRTSENCWTYGSGELDMTFNHGVNCEVSFRIPDPPGVIAERVESWDCTGRAKAKTVYVLNTDGRVWAWHYQGGSGPFDWHFAAAPGVILGMIIGIVLVGRVNKPVKPVEQNGRGNPIAKNR